MTKKVKPKKNVKIQPKDFTPKSGMKIRSNPVSTVKKDKDTDTDTDTEIIILYKG